MDHHCNGHLVHPSHHQHNTNTINTGCTMFPLTLIVVNLMAMAIYIPYLLDKERRYDDAT